MEYKDPGKYVPIVYLLYSWGSRLGVPSRVPLILKDTSSFSGDSQILVVQVPLSLHIFRTFSDFN